MNPASAATAPRVPAPDINPPAPRDLARVFALATEWDIEFSEYIVLAAATGARRSELVALRWADVDLDRGSVASLDGLVKKDTKTHAARRVSLDPTCAAAMPDHRARAVERAKLAECDLPPLAFVFSYEVDGSRSWNPDSVSRTFARLSRKAGLRGGRLHDLRHYVATHLLASGVDVRTVPGRFGRRNASTTLNVYSHLLAEADRDAANLLGKIFDDAVADARREAPCDEDEEGPTSRSA